MYLTNGFQDVRFTNLLHRYPFNTSNDVSDMDDSYRFVPTLDHEALFPFILLDSLGQFSCTMQVLGRRVGRTDFTLQKIVSRYFLSWRRI